MLPCGVVLAMTAPVPHHRGFSAIMYAYLIAIKPG
jgi:hypothetical protein